MQFDLASFFQEFVGPLGCPLGQRVCDVLCPLSLARSNLYLGSELPRLPAGRDRRFGAN